nr:signal anchor, putative [Tanacetum cinerariifolium]
MNRDVIMIGSTMRITLLYQGEYSQWRERFMNYLEEMTDGEAMINSIQNGDQPLPIIAQVSLVGNVQNKGDIFVEEEAPLLPKLRGYFAEFLRESCLAPLGPDSPYVDEPLGGTLRFSGHWILTNVCITQADILTFTSSTTAHAGASL